MSEPKDDASETPEPTRWVTDEELQASAALGEDEHPLLRLLRNAPISTRPVSAQQLEEHRRAKTANDWVSSEEVFRRLAELEAGHE